MSITQTYSLEYEEQRRQQLESLFHRTRGDEKSENQLKEELKAVESDLRKLKKAIATQTSAKKHGNAAGAAADLSSDRATGKRKCWRERRP